MGYNQFNKNIQESEESRKRRIRRERNRKREVRRRKKRIRLIKAYSLLLVVIITCVLLLIVFVKTISSFYGEKITDETIVDEVQEVDVIIPLIDLLDIDVQLVPINEYSRPGIKVESIDKIVIHYVGNPRTTAQQNRDYYESLIEGKDAKISSNYIVGLEGEIIECVPPGEIAYASNEMNGYSISIEVCHYDESGEFTAESYHSTIQLAAALCQKYNLTSDDVIRHYDVTGKECPIYYVEHEDAWEQMKNDINEILMENVN